VLLGRLLFVLIFLMVGPNHFSKQTIAFAASQGVPFASFAVPMSGVLARRRVERLARLSRKDRRVIDCIVSHSRDPHKFWTVHDAMMAQMQMVMFMKNIAILGGALMISQLGAGPMSLDAWRSR